MTPLALPHGYSLLQRLSTKPDGDVVLAERESRRFVLRLGRQSVEEVRSELTLLAEFRHPDLAELTDHGPLPGGGVFVARPYVEGLELEEWAQGRSPEAVAEVVARLVPPLMALHRAGWVHGDVKATNVVVRSGDRPVLLDFGLATKDRGPVGGTEFYLAPELITGGTRTPASDAFALGVLLQRLIAPTSVSPQAFYGLFPSRPYLEALGLDVAVLPEWSRDLVVGLTARDPERRTHLSSVGRMLGARLGFELDAPVEAPWNVSDLVGRMGWFDARSRDDLEPSEPGSRRTWWLAREAADAEALYRAVRVRLSLRNANESGLRLSELCQCETAGELLESVDTRLASLVGTTALFVDEDSPWSRRALRLLEGGARSNPNHSGLLVLAAFPPPDETWSVQDVPDLDPSEVVAHVVERHGAGSRSAAEKIAAVARTRSELVATIEDAAARGRLLVTDEGWNLVPGTELRPLGGLEVRTDSERLVLEALELLDRPATFGALQRVLESSADELTETARELIERGLMRANGTGRLVARRRGTFAPDARTPGMITRAVEELRAEGTDTLRIAVLRSIAEHETQRTDSDSPALEELLPLLEEVRASGSPERVLALVDEWESLAPGPLHFRSDSSASMRGSMSVVHRSRNERSTSGNRRMPNQRARSSSRERESPSSRTAHEKRSSCSTVRRRSTRRLRRAPSLNASFSWADKERTRKCWSSPKTRGCSAVALFPDAWDGRCARRSR